MASGALPVIYVSGSNYEIGVQIGKTFRSLIQTAVQINKSLRNHLLPYYGTNEGDRVYEEFLRVAEECVPHYIDELRGIAKGSHIPFHHLFLLHLESEIIALAAQGADDSGGCSDIQLLADDVAVIAHTEDGCPEWKDYGYVVNAHIKPTERNGYTEERFLAFCYPGLLPGYAYSVNQYGLVITGNVVESNEIYSKGRIARRILCRAVVGAKSMKDAVRIIKELPGIGAGFHFNMGQKTRRKKRSTVKFRKMGKVVASTEKETDSSEDESEKRSSKEDETSDSSSPHIDKGMPADKVEEEIVSQRENRKGESVKIVTEYCEEVTKQEVDDTEEDVRVEMMESVGEVIEDQEYFQNEIELKNLQELEDMIQKYFILENEPVSKKFVQEVERVYTYGSSDEPVVEELIEPQIAFPLEAVCKGMYNDANDKKSDSGSSSSDSDSSEDGASNKLKKKKKKSPKPSDDDDAKESENSDSEDEFEEAVEKHGKSDSEHEAEETNNNEENDEKHITKVESEEGTEEEHIEKHVTISKQEVDGGTEVITEKHVTLVKTQIVGDIDPEEKERIMQEMREKLEEERKKIREDNSSDSEHSKEKEEGNPGSSDSASDAEEKDQPLKGVIDHEVTFSKKETITEKRVTVVKTEIVGDLDPEEKERIIQEMKDKLAEEGEKLHEQKIPESAQATEEMKHGSSDSESDFEPREIRNEKRDEDIQEISEEGKEVTRQKGSDSESEREEEVRKQIEENKSNSSGSDTDENAEIEEHGEETIEEHITVTKHEADGGTEIVTEKHMTIVTTEIIGSVDPEEKEKIIQEMKSKLEDEKEGIAGQKGSDSESEKEERSGSSDSESDSGVKDREETDTAVDAGSAEIVIQKESDRIDEQEEDIQDAEKHEGSDDSESGSDSEEEQRKVSKSENDKEVEVTVMDPERETIEKHVTVIKEGVDGEMEVITEKHVTAMKMEVVGDIDPEEKERIIQEMKDNLEVERNEPVEKSGSESENEQENMKESESSSDTEKESPEIEKPFEKIITEAVSMSKPDSDSESDKDDEGERKSSDDEKDINEFVEKEKDYKEKRSDFQSSVDEMEKKERKSSSSGSDGKDTKQEDENTMREDIAQSEEKPAVKSDSESDTDDSKEKKKDSSESESDTEKQEMGKEKDESEKEDILQAKSKEEGERPEETELPVEDREIELVQEIPAQQYAMPPREEETDEEVKEESESESDSDLSDLEEGETKIRFGSLEIAGDESGTKMDMKNISGFYCHTNQYLRLDVGVKDAFISKNSQTRENRVKELTSEGNPKTVDDVLSIMGDTKDPRFPIWRTGRYPDIWATMSLGVFNFKTEELMIFRENPKTNPTYAAFQFPK